MGDAVVSMPASEIIAGMIEKLSTKEKFTRGWFARDSGGHRATSTSDRAVAWCVLGAMNAVCAHLTSVDPEVTALRYIADAAGVQMGDISRWSDASDYETVVGALRRARERAADSERQIASLALV